MGGPGVFAPAAGLRNGVVPGPVVEHPPPAAGAEPRDEAIQRLGMGRESVVTIPRAPSRIGSRKAWTWAELVPWPRHRVRGQQQSGHHLVSGAAETLGLLDRTLVG